MEDKMILLALLGLVACVNADCLHRRESGLLDNGFDITTANFPGDVDQDSNDAFGNDHTVTMTNNYFLFDTTGATDVTIHDNGIVTFNTDGTDIPFTTQATPPVNMPMAAPKWFADASGSGVKYHFKYRKMLRADQFTGAASTGPSLCDIELVEERIDRFYNRARGTTKCTELLIVTWRIFTTGVGAAETKFQFALCVDVPASETYMLFIYGDAEGLSASYFQGFINGDYANAANSEYNLICNANDVSGTSTHGPNAATTSAQSAVILANSNTECSSPGTYVFRTKDNGAATPLRTKNVCTGSDFATVCAFQVDDGQRVQPACRNPVATVGSCREPFYCYRNDANNANSVKIDFYGQDRASLNYDFLNYEKAILDPIEYEAVDPRCDGTFDSNDFFTRTVSIAGTPSCGIKKTGDVLNFAVWISNTTVGADPTYLKPGEELILGTCDISDLPLSIMVTNKLSEIESTTNAHPNRAIEMGISDRYALNGNQELMGQTVRIGRNIYPYICFDTSTPFFDNADPYGIYTYSCEVSNNADFSEDPSNDKYKLDLTNSNGCQTHTDMTHPFYLQSSFKNGAFSMRTGKFCQITGALRATRWVPNKEVYIRCKVLFCSNKELQGVSRCTDTCANTVVDSNRKRRQANELQEEIVETNINVVPDYELEEEKLCINNTVAMTTIAALIVLLVLATAVAIIMFVMISKKRGRKMK